MKTLIKEICGMYLLLAAILILSMSVVRASDTLESNISECRLDATINHAESLTGNELDEYLYKWCNEYFIYNETDLGEV